MGAVRRHYAAVVATLALFVALGGGAYAALELPPGSVHSVQLASGAVTRSKLAFALGMSATRKLERNRLPGPPPSTCPRLAPCPAALAPSAEIAATTLTLKQRGRILVLATADFALSAPQSETGAIVLRATVDGRGLGSADGAITGGNGNTIPFQGFVANASAGRHRVALIAMALDPTPTLVGAVSLSAIAIPPA
jgi:hypothetical protein